MIGMLSEKSNVFLAFRTAVLSRQIKVWHDFFFFEAIKEKIVASIGCAFYGALSCTVPYCTWKLGDIRINLVAFVRVFASAEWLVRNSLESLL